MIKDLIADKITNVTQSIIDIGIIGIITLIEANTWIKILGSTLFVVLVAIAKYIDIKTKKQDLKNKELDFENKKLDKRIKLKELAEND
jgi:hypothetical protein